LYLFIRREITQIVIIIEKYNFYQLCTNCCQGQLHMQRKLLGTINVDFHTADRLLIIFFGVLLTMHLNIFISVFNQLDAQNLFHNKFYFMPLHVSSTCTHHQEVKIALHSLWYHHTYRWQSRAQVEREA